MFVKSATFLTHIIPVQNYYTPKKVTFQQESGNFKNFLFNRLTRGGGINYTKDNR